MDIKRNIEKLLFESGLTNYQISKATGIAQTTLSRFTRKESDIENMSLKNALKLNKYYEEMNEMKTWEFENYTVYEETDVLRFENEEGDVIGNVYKDEHNVEALINGANPIADGWEDGIGNTLDIDGWGEYAKED